GLQSLDLYRFISFFRLQESKAALYVAGCLSSQVISNVPATILLAPVTADRWRVLLYAVNAGGCGTIIASLANLLGWQIYREERRVAEPFLWRFLILNVVFLVLVGGGAWLVVN